MFENRIVPRSTAEPTPSKCWATVPSNLPPRDPVSRCKLDGHDALPSSLGRLRSAVFLEDEVTRTPRPGWGHLVFWRLRWTNSNAGRTAAVESAKTRVELAEVARDVAKARVKLQQAIKEHREDLAAEARMKWLVALATHESAKFAAIKGSGPEHDERRAKLDVQLKHKQAHYAEAKEESAESAEDVQEAKDHLADEGDQ